MAKLPCPHCGYDLSATPVTGDVRLCSECGRESRAERVIWRGLSPWGWAGFCVGAVAVNTLALLVGMASSRGTALGLSVLVGYALSVAAVFPAFVLDATPPGGTVERSKLGTLAFKAAAIGMALELVAWLAYAVVILSVVRSC